MKTRTKLLTAVLSTVTALSCALTAAALTNAPDLTLQGNANEPAKLVNGSAEATLTLKASDFSQVAGAKLTLTLPTGITLDSATVTDKDTANKWDLQSGQNYAVKNNTVTLVDVFNIGDATQKTGALELELKFTVKDTSIGQYEIEVAGDFADSAEDLKNGTTKGVLVIGKEEKSYTAADISGISVDSEKEFIPYGGAYTLTNGEYTYYDKQTSGNIDFEGATGNVTVLKCKLPDANVGITTFGASKSTFKDSYSNNTIQFGSYTLFSSSKSYGTLLVVGDFNDMVNYYLTNKPDKYATAEDVVAKVMKLINDNHIENATYVKFTYDKTNSKAVYVAKIARSTYMWRNSEEDANVTQLQYALRVHDIADKNKDVNYTAIGYSVDSSENYKFSTEIKTATLAGLD